MFERLKAAYHRFNTSWADPADSGAPVMPWIASAIVIGLATGFLCLAIYFHHLSHNDQKQEISHGR